MSSEKDSLFIIILENGNLNDLLAQAFVQKLTTMGYLLSNYHGIQPPSQVNYWALSAGSIFSDYTKPTNENINLRASNIYDLLDKKGISWKVYMENYPGACFSGANSKTHGMINKNSFYVRKHNPAISFDNIRKDPLRCQKIVDAKDLLKDIIMQDLPQFAFYTPNNMNNGHDTNPEFTDDYLFRHWGPLFLDSRFMRNRTVIITYDENGDFEVPSGTNTCNIVQRENPIYTLILGPNVEVGENDEFYTHYNLLRTIEDHFDLGTLGRCDAQSKSIEINRKDPNITYDEEFLRLDNFTRDMEDIILSV